MLNQRKACQISNPADEVVTVWARIRNTRQERRDENSGVVCFFFVEAQIKAHYSQRGVLGTFTKKCGEAICHVAALNTRTVDVVEIQQTVVATVMLLPTNVCLVRFSLVHDLLSSSAICEFSWVSNVCPLLTLVYMIDQWLNSLFIPRILVCISAAGRTREKVS